MSLGRAVLAEWWEQRELGLGQSKKGKVVVRTKHSSVTRIRRILQKLDLGHITEGHNSFKYKTIYSPSTS